MRCIQALHLTRPRCSDGIAPCDVAGQVSFIVRRQKGTRVDIGELTLPGYRFVAHTACMFRRTSSDGQRFGWGFHIAAESPDGPADVFPNAAGLWAEDEPIPLPDVEDFTGLDFSLSEPGRAESGTAYFVFDAWEGYEVAEVRIRFLERQGTSYRVELSARVPHLFAVPTGVRYSGWVRVTQGPPPDAEPLSWPTDLNKNEDSGSG